jgi:hypothetical protein
VSLDGLDWTTIDERKNSTELRSKMVTGTFGVAGCGSCDLVRLFRSGKSETVMMN